MRIISGTARGIQIQAPKGRDIRPTLDRVRESVFNILAPELDGAHFADLFCGTGANGLEALSRGAARAVLLDSSAGSIACARTNAEKARLASRCRFTRAALPERLDGVLRPIAPVNLVYLDPPFDYGEYGVLLEALANSEALASDAIVVLEHSSRVEVPENAGDLQLYRTERYGETSVSFYRCGAG